jgi:hypothetical protein
MKTKTFNILVLAVLFGFSGCRARSLSPINSRLLDPQGKFTLDVGNFCSTINPVDIRVEIDGELVIHEYFRHRHQLGHMHKMKNFKISLQPGKHQIKVSSTKGAAKLSKDFEVTGEHWAHLLYSVHPQSSHKQFIFSIRESPPIFQ